MTHLQGKMDRSLWQKQATTWFLHSTYQRTFNLTNQHHQELALVAPIDFPSLPGGIYLPYPIFDEVFGTIQQLQKVTLHENQLVFYLDQKKVTVTMGETLDSRLQIHASILPSECLFLRKIQENNEMTGFDYPLSAFSSAKTFPFRQEIQGLFSNELTDKQQSLTYLVGRGRGLTPSGDDFLLGWLLVQQLKQDNLENNELIMQKAKSPDYTTDVSRHYLRQAATGCYSQALLNLAKTLVEPANEQVMAQRIAEIVAHGHSSGADTLAGIAVTLIEMRRRK